MADFENHEIDKTLKRIQGYFQFHMIVTVNINIKIVDQFRKITRKLYTTKREIKTYL